MPGVAQEYTAHRRTKSVKCKVAIERGEKYVRGPRPGSGSYTLPFHAKCYDWNALELHENKKRKLEYTTVPIALPSGAKAIVQLPHPLTSADSAHLIEFLGLYIKERAEATPAHEPATQQGLGAPAIQSPAEEANGN